MASISQMVENAWRRDYQSPLAGQERLRPVAFLAFFSRNILRGGPRFLIHLASALVTLMILIRLFPLGVFEAIPSSLHYSKHSESSNFAAQISASPEVKKHEQEAKDCKGPRIIVFGENDIATPKKGDLNLTGFEWQSWTQGVCEQVGP